MNKAAIWGILALAAVGGGAYLYLKGKDKQETTTSDKTTNDISDRETQQAMKLYNMLGVEKTGGIVWRLATFHNIPEEKVINLMLEVTNWPKLQEKFRGLCNNEYSLTKALSDGLTADEYKKAIDYAAAKKVVTAQDNAFVTINSGNFSVPKNFDKNTVIGALKSDGQYQYVFVNEYTDDGKEITGYIYKNQAKLV